MHRLIYSFDLIEGEGDFAYWWPVGDGGALI